MTKDEIMRLAAQVWSANGMYIGPSIAQLSEFAALVTAKEREARIAAQTENEKLKGKLVASDLAQRRAVREALAAASKPLTDEQIVEIASTPTAVPGSYVHSFARAIERAHGITGEKNQ